MVGDLHNTDFEHDSGEIKGCNNWEYSEPKLLGPQGTVYWQWSVCAQLGYMCVFFSALVYPLLEYMLRWTAPTSNAELYATFPHYLLVERRFQLLCTYII